MSYETILYDVAEGVATITLNRPERLNAFNDAMIAETTEAFKRAGRDAGVRCVVLTGSGRGFCAGGDVSAMRARPEDYSVGDHLRHTYHRLVRRIYHLEKPVIGALNGVVAGAGCGIALATDLRIASEEAGFVLAFSKVGLIPDNGTNWLLPRLIGQARAYQLAVTAEKLSIEKALDWGLVNAVVPPDQFQATVSEWAQRLAEGATLAFALTKRAMNKGWETTFDEALDYEAYLQDTAGHSADHKEGVQAFVEKRKPKFTGK